MLGSIGYIFNLIFSFPILNVLVLLYHLFGDLALSIIVMTLIIKLILFPLTVKQLKSMKATQALQPQMAEIKKKYAKDQQAQALAMQALYKEYGINPLSGCLPLLIQLPVLYGLYQALNIMVHSATQLKTLNDALYFFVPKFSVPPNVDLNWFTWINPAWHFSLALPDPTHILPILAALATFVQLRMSQASQAKTTVSSNKNDTANATMQSMKYMQYIMPLFTLFIGWTFPAGLALYWTISSIFQAVQQYLISGWGGLMPANLPFGNKENNNDRPSKNAMVVSSSSRGERIEVSGEAALEGNGSGAIASHMHTTPRVNGSTPAARKRQRTSSASARRRNSTQRSR